MYAIVHVCQPMTVCCSACALPLVSQHSTSESPTEAQQQRLSHPPGILRSASAVLSCLAVMGCVCVCVRILFWASTSSCSIRTCSQQACVCVCHVHSRCGGASQTNECMTQHRMKGGGSWGWGRRTVIVPLLILVLLSRCVAGGGGAGHCGCRTAGGGLVEGDTGAVLQRRGHIRRQQLLVLQMLHGGREGWGHCASDQQGLLPPLSAGREEREGMCVWEGLLAQLLAHTLTKSRTVGKNDTTHTHTHLPCCAVCTHRGRCLTAEPRSLAKPYFKHAFRQMGQLIAENLNDECS